MSKRKLIISHATGSTNPERPILLPTEKSGEGIEQKQITPEELKLIQETADNDNILLPTAWNRALPREYAPDSNDDGNEEEHLLPTS